MCSSINLFFVFVFFLLGLPCHSFHDGSLNFHQPDTIGYYDGSLITGINSPKVTISHEYLQEFISFQVLLC